jgi:hypothetical protein
MFSSVRSLVEDSPNVNVPQNLSKTLNVQDRTTSFCGNEAKSTPTTSALSLPITIPNLCSSILPQKQNESIYNVPQIFPNFALPPPSAFIYDPVAITSKYMRISCIGGKYANFVL